MRWRALLVCLVLAGAPVGCGGSSSRSATRATTKETADPPAPPLPGWSRLVNDTAGFSLSLPPGWRATRSSAGSSLIRSTDRALAVAVSADRSHDGEGDPPATYLDRTVRNLPGYRDLRAGRAVGRAPASGAGPAAAGEPVQPRDDTADLLVGLAQGLDRAQRRAAAGDHVLHHQAAVAGIERRALDSAHEPVLLALLAHEEGLDVGARGQRRARDGIGPHREAADGRRAEGVHLAGDQLAERREARPAQDRSLGIDVIGGGRAAR